MSRQWRWSMKNALARTLSHPTHPPTHPPRNPPNQHPAYEHLCHVNEDDPWRTHYQEPYHTPPPPTHPPETPPTNTQRMNTYVTSMKMIHEERTSKNVITPPHPPTPPETPPTNTQRMNTYVTSMKMIHEEHTSKNVITPPHPWLSCASILKEKGTLNPCCAFILKGNGEFAVVAVPHPTPSWLAPLF